MPDAPAIPATPETPVDQPKPEAPTDKPLGENGEKALKAERDARAAAEKQAATLQKQLDDIAAANLSDLERAQKAASDAQAEVTKAQADALRFRIAAETGITKNVDLILTAADEQTLRAQALLWADRPDSATPKPDLSQGTKADPPGGDPAQDFANFIAAQRGS